MTHMGQVFKLSKGLFIHGTIIDDTDLTIVVDAAGIVDCESFPFAAIAAVSIGYDDRR